MTDLGRTRRIHFVGIGGIGMSGIAELVANLGYEVSGSDLRRSAVTERLASLGVGVQTGHDARHAAGADVVVTSSAVPAGNPEVAWARAAHVPVIPRAEMLAELMRLKRGIAIAGAHGKTTTTSMVALMLERAGLDPTAVIGGRLSAFGSNARLGQGDYMVVEADESDRSFLRLSPVVAVITNIDREHMDTYESMDQLEDAFAAFAARVPFYGAVVACVDDPRVRALVPRITRRVVTYGFAADADVRGLAPETDGRSGRCRVEYAVRGLPAGTGQGGLVLSVPGLHNLQNALAALAVGLEVGLAFEPLVAGLGAFRGAERRYDVRGVVGGITVVDDYGHHPTEIAAVLAAARAGRPGRLVAVFQPHRYSRTRDLLHEFGPALGLADVVVLTDIYSAGEPPEQGVTLEALSAAVRGHAADLRVVPRLADVAGDVAALSRAGDLIVTLGAGSIASTGDEIVRLLASRSAPAGSERAT
jgi:UDP-N-acetylmuramate--alanine ligase